MIKRGVVGRKLVFCLLHGRRQIDNSSSERRNGEMCGVVRVLYGWKKKNVGGKNGTRDSSG